MKKNKKKKAPPKAAKVAAKPAKSSKPKAPPKGKAAKLVPKAAKNAGPTKPAKGAKASDATPGYDAVGGILEAFATNNRINRYMIEHLDEATWHAPPPVGRGRSIAAIVCHIHNARVMWLDAARNAGKAPRPPAKLDRLAATKEEALKALDLSHAAIAKMVAPALKGDGKVANFKSGASAFVAYLITHDAHHRGQICLQAKLVGHPLPQAAGYGMWEWSKR